MPAIPFELALLLLVGSAVALRVSLHVSLAVLIFIATLWLAGMLYPLVRDAVGLPQATLYQLGHDAIEGAADKIATVTAPAPTPTPTPTPRPYRFPVLDLRPAPGCLLPAWTGMCRSTKESR